MERQKNQNNSSVTRGPEEVCFEKLTPNGEIDISNYESALDFALIKSENKDITNVAMTGLYGSGKSSVLKAYENKKSGKLTFLNISLAHYQGAGDMETKNLEGKIVNQLFHQIDYKKIPQTIFKIKDNTSRKTAWLYSFGIIFMIGLVYGWMNLKSLTRVLKSIIKVSFFDSFLNSSWFGILWFDGTGILAILLLYKLIKIQIDKRPLKSLKIGGNQIEILEESKESYFDKFMNDVIYLFVNSGADVIVFEDLDRFDDQTIYEKLREINILANKRRETVEKGFFLRKPVNKKLSFLYLIKDDMFKSKDRTKFFDFIIPIVPAMDSSNSYQKFLEAFDNLKIKGEFNERLLKKLALYIDDYRLLKNVANEYYLYKMRIESSGVALNKDKLLALMIYKNIFPSDFSALQYGKSYLNAIFAKKEELLQEETPKINAKLEELQKDVEAAQAEQLTNFDELDALYLKNPYSNITVNNKKEIDFPNRASFIAGIKENNFKVTVNHSYSNYYDLRDNFDELNNNKEYLKRRKNIENISSMKTKDLALEKKRLNSQLDKIRARSIKDLLVNKDTEFFKKVVEDGPKEIDKEGNDGKSVFEYLLHSDYFDLLLVLVRDELIDEKYSDYMTYFYEGNLSKNDKAFVREIFDHKKPDENYIPKNPEEILSIIQAVEFTQYHIRNIFLSSWILSKRKQYKVYCNLLLNDLKEVRDTKFIYKVYLTSKNKETHFWGAMKENWPEIVINIINAEDLDDNEKLQFVSDYLIHSDYDAIKSLNNLNQLIFYIGQSNLLSSDIISEKDMLKKLPELQELGVEFARLNDDPISKNIIFEITKLKSFKMTKENIEVILRAFNKSLSPEAFNGYNYTAITGLGEKLIEDALFGEKFNQYFLTYLNFGNTTLFDKPEDVVTALNSENIEQDTKLRYIERVRPSSKIQSISAVKEKELWWKLAKTQAIAATTSNIIGLLENNGWKLREELILLINAASEPIKFNSAELENEKSLKIFNAIVVDEEIKSDQYISMISSLNCVYNDIALKNIPGIRMKALIENHIIRFTEKNLVSIRANHSGNIDDFAFVNFDEYMKALENEEYLDNEELINLLQSKEFSIPQKKEMIDKVQHTISIKEDNYEDEIKQYILENKFDIEDIDYLTSEYDEFSKMVQETVYLKISNDDNIKNIISNNLSLTKKLLSKLLLDTEVKIDDRQSIFAKNIWNFSELEVVEWVQKLSLPADFVNVLNQKKVTIDNTELNLEIASQYKEKNWITSFEEIGDKLVLQGKKILNK